MEYGNKMLMISIRIKAPHSLLQSQLVSFSINLRIFFGIYVYRLCFGIQTYFHFLPNIWIVEEENEKKISFKTHTHGKGVSMRARTISINYLLYHFANLSLFVSSVRFEVWLCSIEWILRSRSQIFNKTNWVWNLCQAHGCVRKRQD